MTEEAEGLESGAGASAVSIDPAALALGLASADRERANAFLEKQEALIADQQNLVRLQAKELAHELKLRHWSLQLRHASSILKFALEVSVALIAVTLAFFLGAALWNAAHSDGMVIESFSVPAALAQAGDSGDVVAAEITNKVAAIRREILTYSLTATKDVSTENKEEVRVEIPDTGISLSEAWRFLRNWLGHERHVTGTLYDQGDAGITLAVSIPGASPIALNGKSGDLDKLEDAAAEKIYAAVDPVNSIVYLFNHHRYEEANAAAAHWAAVQVTPTNRGDAYSLWGLTTWLANADVRLATAREQLGDALNPDSIVDHATLGDLDSNVGRDESELRERRAVLVSHSQKFDQSPLADSTIRFEQTNASERIADLTGDFAQSVGQECYLNCSMATMLVSRAKALARLHDPSASRDLMAKVAIISAAPQDEGTSVIYPGQARYYEDSQDGRWGVAKVDALDAAAQSLQGLGPADSRLLTIETSTIFRPLAALAEAHLGEFVTARQTIGATRDDCYDCVRTRGIIEALAKNWSGAQYWFADAVRQAPSVPFAYADWGEMQLARGEPDAAIAEFKLANEKGPHFADALEGWGEALMTKNRSDLALAKFTEANKYAPNWGHLHLRWGEALVYAGKVADAKQQFILAARLDLAPADKAELVRMAEHD